MRYYSENWYEATEKFIRSTIDFGNLKWCVSPNSYYDIPYVKIGDGANQLVINSGVHGIEGYFGSAAQLMFLNEIAPKISDTFLQDYTITIIHVINGWGMQNRMRETRDKDGGLVDLNRNFGIDFSKPENLPTNPLYHLSHDLLLSAPDPIRKKNAIKAFRSSHLHDGAWSAISWGQYDYPHGLFYGGASQTDENKMTMAIYDEIMHGANKKSLVSVGLHTGLGRFNRRDKYVTGQLLVSHPSLHQNTQFFKSVCNDTEIVPDESAVFGPTLLGDLVDCLESRYGRTDCPVYTADFEIGTGEFPIMSPVFKRMDMGDARYDLLHCGKINPTTRANLTESWYPSDNGWRDAALNRARVLFSELISNLHVRD